MLKAFASRSKDWVDIEGIVIRQGNLLDWSYIERALQPLCELKENEEILNILRTLRDKIRNLPGGEMKNK